jgi:predicted Zn-dependent protease
MKKPQAHMGATLLALSMLLASCGSKVVNPVSGRAERSVMDETAEIAEGAKAHQQVMSEYGAYDNTRLQTYVNNLGQRLAAQSHRASLKWTFTVLDSPEVNAFALPGGYVYVTRGIMAFLDSEAELAGVMGHEIGHVTARHGAQRATREQKAGLGVFAATILGAVLEARGVGGAAQAAAQVGQGVAAGYVATYSREQESQADELGAEYLARTRYDPQNMVDVIKVLKSQELFAADAARAAGRAPPSGGNWLASHPSNDKRLADIKQIAAGYSAAAAASAPAKAAFVDDGRARYQAAIDGMNFGESRSQGVTRGQHFFHEELGIALTAPPGWHIQNAADAISLVAPTADAALVVHTVPADAGNSHEEIIRSVLKPSEGRVEKRSFNGLQASHFVGQRRDAQGQTSSIEVTVVSGPGGRNYLLQYAAKDAAARQRAGAGLLQAEASFRPMSAIERTAARPWVLKAVPLPRGGFAELARSSPLPAPAEAQLRLINGVYGETADPKPGWLVKVVQ